MNKSSKKSSLIQTVILSALIPVASVALSIFVMLNHTSI